MTVDSVLSDAKIWAVLLFIAVGAGAVVATALVWVLTVPATGPRLTPVAARAATKRVLYAAVVIYIAAFVAGGIVGLLQ